MMTSKLQTICFVLILLAAGSGMFYLARSSSSPVELRERGIFVYKPEKFYRGLSLYNSTRDPRAFLIDMEGNEVHRWQGSRSYFSGWHHVEPTGNGRLLVVVTGHELLKVDWNSSVVWTVPGDFHHDVDVQEDGTIFALSREERRITHEGKQFPILDDLVLVLNSRGEILERHSIYDIVGKLVPSRRLDRAYQYIQKQPGMHVDDDTPSDLFHTNSIEVMRKSIRGFGEAGHVLLSVRELNRVVLVDLKRKKLVWEWGAGVLDHQHNAQVLPTGHVLLLDNGKVRGNSLGIEINPATKRVVWKYGSGPGEDFFTNSRGGIQRLPNGNSLLTVAVRDLAFEVTPQNELVWKYKYPMRLRHKKRKSNHKKMMYRVTRLPVSHPFFERDDGTSYLEGIDSLYENVRDK